MIYHVSVNGCDTAAGTVQAPFRTINHAASIAVAGDTVQVHGGEYREWVKPVNGGLNELTRIVYEAAPGEHPVIKGSEIVTDWEHVEGTVWKKVLPNEMFGDWNPYVQRIEGDWLWGPRDYWCHTGDVYINGRSMFEASSMEDLYEAPQRVVAWERWWRNDYEPVQHPELSIYRWYAQVDVDTTTLLCNFQDVDPNKELIEINVRKCCFFPERIGLDYITVRGFEMAHAACPFTPPSADQPGMLGPHWSKGWIIENNHLHDAKCSAISLGKEISTGHNMNDRFGRKSAHRYQKEAVFRALLYAGWCKEKVGSHIVRNNLIHDCGQNGIVGHMGSAFCRIEHNHIYNIAMKREFFGHEIGGIKLHAAIDTVIKGNNVHHCVMGTWLDWQAQGARVTGNLYYSNYLDFMIEVTHGPCSVDNNIMLSDSAVLNVAQGTAFTHNLIAGSTCIRSSMNRETPYHIPHSTQVLCVAPAHTGDDRLMNNLFLGTKAARGEDRKLYAPFCAIYDRFTTEEEYLQAHEEYENPNYFMPFYEKTPQPVWIAGNAYAGFAQPFRKEDAPIMAEGMMAQLEQEDDKWVLSLSVPEQVASAACEPVTTQRLGTPRFTEQPYENPDGSPIDFTPDYLGNCRSGNVIPGPFAALKNGTQKIVVWDKNA